MIHRTFRSLDEPPKLVGFTIKQWLALIAGAGTVLGLVELSGLPTKAAVSLCVFVVGLPAALTYVSESGGLQISVLLRAMCRWRFSAHTLPAACGAARRVRRVLLITEDARMAQEAHVEASASVVEDAVRWERWG